MKRVLSVFLIIAMVISIAPSVFVAALETKVTEGTCGSNVVWSFDEESSTLTISGQGAMRNYGFDVLQEYYDVLYNVSSIVIEEGVTSIGANAFAYCSAVEVSFPSTLKKIGAFAFAKADQLKKITYNGSNIETIEERAFYGCWSLDNFYIFNPNCVIGQGAFDEAYDGSISGYAGSSAETYAKTYYWVEFNYLNGTCGENLKWELNSNLELVIEPEDATLPNKMTEWNESVWMPWENLGSDIVSVYIADGVGDITGYTFTNCPNLCKIVVPSSVNEIGENAFDSDNENLEIHGYYGSIAEEYARNNNLTFVSLSDDGESPIVHSGTCGDNVTWMLDELTGTLVVGGEGEMYNFNTDQNPPEYFPVRDKISRVVIEDGVTTIGECAFQYCDALTEVVLPASLSCLGDFAFAKSGLSFIEYNNCEIDSIGDYVFYGCGDLTSFSVYNPYSSFGAYAFSESGISTLVGYAGSTAETYATEHGMGFVAFDDGDEPAPPSEPEPEPGVDTENFVLPIELRFNKNTYFTGSVMATVNVFDMTDFIDYGTQTVSFHDVNEIQYLEFPVPNHTNSSRYFVRVVFRGPNDTNINTNVHYYYAKHGGLTTKAQERAYIETLDQPIVIYAPTKNTVSGRLNLPEDFWCEDEDAKISELWVDIYDDVDNYIGYAIARVDENLYYSFELPTQVVVNYTLMARPIFTKGAERKKVYPKTNLIIKKYELFDEYENKKFYSAGTDGTPVFGANFNLETGYVLSGTIDIPEIIPADARPHLLVSGFKPDYYSPAKNKGDYYFEIEYEEGKREYDWHFAVEKDRDIVLGYNLEIENIDLIETELLEGTFFYREAEEVISNFDSATRYWVAGDVEGICLELKKGRKIEVVAYRPDGMNGDMYVNLDVEIENLDGVVISKGIIEIHPGEIYGEVMLTVSEECDEIYLKYDVNEFEGPDTWLYDLPVYVGSDYVYVKGEKGEALPWDIRDINAIDFTPLVDEVYQNAVTAETIIRFVNEIYAFGKDNNHASIFAKFNESKEIFEYMGLDYTEWTDNSDRVRLGIVEIMATKIGWLAIEFTPAMFVQFFKEAVEISRISRAESFQEMRERLCESERLSRIVSLIESLNKPLVYRNAYILMQDADVAAWDHIEGILSKVYEDARNDMDNPSSGGGGGSGGGGVSLVINAVDSNTLEVIEGAQIYVSNDETAIYHSDATDDEGKVYFPVPTGVYSVQAIANGYQVRNFVVEKTDDNFEFTVYMSKNDILQVETRVKEMSYDEIVDAGIDINAIENKQVYNCTAVLTFTPTSSSGSVGGGGGSSLPTNITFDYICTDTEVFNAEPVRFGNTSVCPVAKDIYLIIYSSTTWLKEMFEVQLLVTNTSAIEKIRDCVAKINLPEGLSLAVMNDELGQQSEELSIGMIDPKGSADVRWYLCGDAEGEYTISGNVVGVREGGGISEEVSVGFTSKEKISVFGGNALNLTIRAEKAATVGEPYRVEYVLQNVSRKDLYNVEINILGGRFLTQYSVEDLTPPYGWEGSLENGFVYRDSVLQSGETLSGVFEVIFAEGIDTEYAEYVLSNMFVVAGSGSTVNVPTSIELVDEIITHRWDNGTVSKDATCTAEGEMTYHCTDDGCDDVKITKIPAKGHNWDDGVITIAPTETADGEKTFTCMRCGERKTEIVKSVKKQDISFLVDTITYTYGDRSAIYHYAYNDSEGGGKITYASSNEDVATVDQRGKITIRNAGETTITATAAAVPEKYLETVTSYKLIVNKAELSIKADDKVIYYGEDVKDISYTVDGFVNGENEAILDGKAVYSYDYQKYDDAGEYVISVSGFNVRNYDIVYETGLLCVEKAVDFEINIGNLTQRKGSVMPIIASTTPRDDSAKLTIEYQNAEGDWQDDIPTEIGEYKVRVCLVESRNLCVDMNSWKEDILTIKAGAMIDVGGDMGEVDVAVEANDEKVEIIVDNATLENVINNIPSTGEIVIDMKGNGEKKELVLPSNLIGALHESVNAKEVTVIADDTEICVSSDALKKVAETMETNDKVGISIGAVDKEELNKEQQQALDAISKDAVVLSLNMVVSKYDDYGNKVAEEKIHEFDGRVNVRAAYDMEEEDGKRVIVCYVSDNGSVTYIRAKYVDGYVEFETDHFSHFAIMTIGGEPGVNVSLRTTEDDWYFDNITVGEYDGEPEKVTAYIGIYNENDVLIGAKTEAFSLAGIESVQVSKIAGAKYAVVYVWEDGTLKAITDKPKKLDL